MKATMQEEFDKQKDVVVTIRLTQEQYQRFKEECDNLGVVEESSKEPYGWVIEQNSAVKYSSDAGKTWKWTGFSGWDRGWKHKVYKTKEIALEALKAMRVSDFDNCRVSYRIIPVYSGEPEVLDNILDLPLKID